MRRIREDPWILSREVDGIAFPTADALAIRLGFPLDGMERSRGATSQALSDGRGDGHCGLMVSDLIARATNLVQRPLDDAFAEMVDDGLYAIEVVDGEQVVFDPRMLMREKRIAWEILERAGQRPAWPAFDVAEAIERQCLMLEIRPGPDQRAAVEMIATNRFSVMTGGPGTGKTTTLRLALDILQDAGVRIAICAPTGMAAKRMSEATGRQAVTVHTLLRAMGRNKFAKNEVDPIEADMIVADETSMMDVTLTAALLRATRRGASILFVGDVDQLPSVGPGRVLHDIISSGKVAVARLTTIYRQGATSRIIKAAHAINAGEVPETAPKDMSYAEREYHFFQRSSDEATQEGILKLVTDSLPKLMRGIDDARRARGLDVPQVDPIRDILVLSPMRLGDAGIDALNLKIRSAVNPLPNQGSDDRLDVQPKKGDGGPIRSFGLGDKVMNTANKKLIDTEGRELRIVNGDIGYVASIDRKRETATVEFSEGVVKLKKTDLTDLQLAYAITIHKSQGSEARAVVMALTRSHSRMLQRNLAYTGITRAREMGVIIGSQEALERAVETARDEKRITFLAQALRDGVEAPPRPARWTPPAPEEIEPAEMELVDVGDVVFDDDAERDLEHMAAAGEDDPLADMTEEEIDGDLSSRFGS